MSTAHSERVASGLMPGALAPMSSLKGCFRKFSQDQSFTFIEAIEPIEEEGIIPDVMSMARITYDSAVDAQRFGALKDDPLDVNGIAVLMKYSEQDTEPALFQDMNQKCYQRDRRKIQPFLPFMWLMLKALQKLEPFLGSTIYRGVRLNLASDYPKDRQITWYSFTSCTRSIEVLERDDFCGKSGSRTIFVISLSQHQARDITRYSLFADEDEILLPPGSRFKVKGVMDAGHGLTIVSIDELPSPEWIIDLCPPSAGVSPVADSGPTFELWHGTSEESALEIARCGHINPSLKGFLGPGVYLTSSKNKAKLWALYAAAGKPAQTAYSQEQFSPDKITSKPALVRVKASTGRCKVLDVSAFRKDYLDIHITVFHFLMENGFLDDFGRLPAVHSSSHSCRHGHRAVRDKEANILIQLQSWQIEGYDSAYAEDTSPLCCRSARVYHSYPPDLAGDEYVLSQATQATYLSHELF